MFSTTEKSGAVEIHVMKMILILSLHSGDCQADCRGEREFYNNLSNVKVTLRRMNFVKSDVDIWK
jgi:hypothetical protein